MRFKRKIILTIIFNITIMLVIGFSYAKFVKRDIEGGDNYNVVIGNTISASEMSPNFTVTYDEGDNIINTEDIIPSYQQLIKFKVSTEYNNIQYIIVSLDSMINTSSGTYGLYNCNETNYNNATYANVSTNCTLISTASDTLPGAGENKLIHSASKLTLNGDSTNYYALTINTLTANNTFKGFILVKKYSPTLIGEILAAYTPVSDNTSSTYVSSGSGIDFASISSPTNGQGLYINNKNSGSGDTYYFRGGTYCYLSGSAIISSATCTTAGGTWSDYHCSLSDSESACTGAGGTFYELKNNLMFAGFAWKIIRINADGAIRVAYNGTSPTARSTSASIGASYYNSSDGDNTYVGYMYGGVSKTTYALTHTNTTNSNIKTMIDTWYQNNLLSYASKLIDSGFCNDRNLYSGVGYGTNTTFYMPNARIYTNKTPSFNCSQSNDLYTLTANSIGNKKLTYPIGTVTADEENYSGASSTVQNYTYYLSSSTTHWTMSPVAFSGTAFIWYVSLGKFANCTPYMDWLVVPVINLKANLKVTGSGTLSDPWVIAS